MKRFKATDILIGIVFTVLFISIGVIAAVNFRSLYYFDIDYLKIPETSGLDAKIIRENYDALIDYNSPFFKGDLQFPSLPSSAFGIQHFIEVKNIFVSFYVLAFSSLILAIMIIFYKKSKRDYSYLFISSLTVILLPIIAVLGCAVNFDAAFVLFHKIFFRNDYWLFDPAADPVITILPDTFFLHSLLLIIAFVFMGSVLLYTIYRILIIRRRSSLTLK